MQVKVHICEVCGRHKCLHCQECGTPTDFHATSCSQYVSKHVVYHPHTGRTFTLIMRDGELLALQRMTNDFPLTWESFLPGDSAWSYWQDRINEGSFDHNVN